MSIGIPNFKFKLEVEDEQESGRWQSFKAKVNQRTQIPKWLRSETSESTRETYGGNAGQPEDVKGKATPLRRLPPDVDHFSDLASTPLPSEAYTKNPRDNGYFEEPAAARTKAYLDRCRNTGDSAPMLDANGKAAALPPSVPSEQQMICDGITDPKGKEPATYQTREERYSSIADGPDRLGDMSHSTAAIASDGESLSAPLLERGAGGPTALLELGKDCYCAEPSPHLSTSSCDTPEEHLLKEYPLDPLSPPPHHFTHSGHDYRQDSAPKVPSPLRNTCHMSDSETSETCLERPPLSRAPPFTSPSRPQSPVQTRSPTSDSSDLQCPSLQFSRSSLDSAQTDGPAPIPSSVEDTRPTFGPEQDTSPSSSHAQTPGLTNLNPVATAGRSLPTIVADSSTTPPNSTSASESESSSTDGCEEKKSLKKTVSNKILSLPRRIKAKIQKKWSGRHGWGYFQQRKIYRERREMIEMNV